MSTANEKWHATRKNQRDFCATCGNRRDPLTPIRKSWGSKMQTPGVPRDEQAEGVPWQEHNDLIVVASVYRNGGTDETCHLCDACLRIGLRALKLEIDRMLSVVEADTNKDAEIAELTNKLASLQHEHSNLAYQAGRCVDAMNKAVPSAEIQWEFNAARGICGAMLKR